MEFAMQPGKDTTVREIMMKGPVTLNCADVVDLANDVMSLGRIRHIPIVDSGKVVGVLSQRDLFHSALVTALGLSPKQRSELLKAISIKEAMSAPVVTIAPETRVAEAARLMLEKKIGCLPVVERGTLVGLLTESDLLRCVAEL